MANLSSQELTELKQLYKDLQNIQIPDMDKFINALGGVESARKNLSQMRKEFANLNSDVTYFAESLTRVLQDLKNQNGALGITKKSYSALSSLANKLKYDQDGISKLSEKELKNLSKKISQERQNLTLAQQLNKEGINKINQELRSISYNPRKIAALVAEKKALTNANNEIKNFLTDQENGLLALEGATNKRIEKEKQLQKAIGLTGNVLKALSKIPGIGSALDTEQALEDMREFAEELQSKGENVNTFSNKLKIAGKGFSTAFGGLKKSLADPVSILTFIVTQALKANAQSVQLGKSLGFGADKANKFRENLANIARFSTNINVTTENLVEGFNQLSEATGFVANYSADTLKTQIMLTKQFGLTGEEAARIYELSVLNGKSSSKVNDEMVGAFVATRNAARVGVNFKQVIAEAAKVSGQLQATFAANPARITAAIVKVKALGTTLEQTKSQGDKLLDFASSLESELQAELLTGKQLNLERARAAALAGDQVALAEELNKNVGTYSDFTKLNVLQQQSLANAVGLTADQLAEQLKKQELAKKSGKSLAEITKQEALDAEKRQSVQDKFNAAILKLQDFFGNLIAGPVGQLLEAITNIIGLITNTLQPVLAVVFTPLTWAVGLLGKMEGLLKTIAGVYLIIKGFQIAGNILEAGKTAQLALQGNALAIQNIMLEKSLVKKAMYHSIAIKEAITEGGIVGLKTYALSLDEKSLARKVIMAGITAKEWVWEKGKATWKLLQLGYDESSLALKRLASVIEKGNLLKSIGSAAMGVIESLSAIPVVGWALGLTAAAGVAALGYKFLSGDDVVSENGYGKRTLLAPEGAIKLNDKDTVIAGTDLGGGGGGMTTSIDLSPMIAAINQVKASVDRLYAKDTSINMDGKKVGTTLSQGSYKVA